MKRKFVLSAVGAAALVLLAVVLSGCVEEKPGAPNNVLFTPLVKGCAETERGMATRDQPAIEREATIRVDGNNIIYDRAISHLCCRKAVIEKEFSNAEDCEGVKGKECNLITIFENWSGEGCKCICNSELGAKIEGLEKGVYLVKVIERGKNPDGSAMEEKIIILETISVPAEQEQGNTTIVYYRGVQCQPEPWPQSPQAVGVTELIKNYYKENHGIEILSISSKSFIVCEACDICPASIEYAAIIYEKDKQKMLELGWKAELSG